MPRSRTSHGNNHLFWLGPPEFRPPGGESFIDLRDRTVRSIERLTDKYRGRDIVATAHGGTIRAALAHAFNMHPEAAVRFEIDNVSITLIEHFEQADPAHAWSVAFTNYMPREIVTAHTAGQQGMKTKRRARGRAGRLLERAPAARCGWAPTTASSAASRASATMALTAADAQPGEHVLDVGCGTGGTTAELAQARSVPAAMCWASTSPSRWSTPRGAQGSPTRRFEVGDADDLSASRRSRSISSSRASA